MNVKDDPIATTGQHKDDADLLKEAIANFDLANTAYSSLRSRARDDLKMVAGAQSSTSSDPYSLSVNLLGPFLRQITSEARSANPAIRVIPEGNNADVDIAEARGGLIRAIEQKSDSENVYQTALWYAAAAGEGYCILDSEYVSNDSFDQNLVIKRVANPEMIFLDPNHEDLTGEDAEWGFIIKDIPQAAYIRQFPSSELAKKLNSTGWNRVSVAPRWVTDKTVRVAQYWVKQYKMKKIWLVADPMTQEQVTLEQNARPGKEWILLRKEPREVQVCEIKGYTLNGLEVLEKIDWPGTRIPIFKCTGESFSVGGESVQYGAVRQAVDVQRQYNYAVSKQTEMIDLAPKNSFVITTKQLGNNAEKWSNANRISYGYLDYTAEPGSPPPSRVSGLDSNAFNGVLQTRQQAYEDMKRVFGLNDSSMGSTTNDMSGVAIGKQVEQGSRSTYQFFDHLLLMMKALGREINNLIPYFYDTDRLVRIVKPTNEDEMIAINSIANGKKYDFTRGEYSVSITTGPAYASKRQEAFDALSGIMSALPQSGQVIGDLVASQVDSPIARLAAARLKATIPPEVLAATGEDDDSDMAPKEQVASLQQQVAMMTMQLKKLDLEKQELEIKAKTLEDTAAMEMTKAELDIQDKREARTLEAQIAQMETQLKVAELNLAHEKLELAKQQLAINAGVAAHRVAEGMKPQHFEDVTNDFEVPSDSNVGGSVT